MDKIEDVLILFPGLKQLDLQEHTRLQIVNDFKAYEIACKLGYLDFTEGKMQVKTVLNFWYLLNPQKHAPLGEFPLLVELSFSYDALEKGREAGQLEQFPLQVVEQTHRLFETFKKQIGWLSNYAMTKTAYSYEQS